MGQKLVVESRGCAFVYSTADGKMLCELSACELVHVDKGTVSLYWSIPCSLRQTLNLSLLFRVQTNKTLIYYSQKTNNTPTFFMFDLKSLEVVSSWPKMTRQHVESAHISGRLFATGSEDGSIHVYDMSSGALVNAFHAHSSFVSVLLVGRAILSGDKCGNACVFGPLLEPRYISMRDLNFPVFNFVDIQSGARLRTLTCSSPLLFVSYNAQKLICGYDEEIREWDFTTHGDG